jgi:uncharacterized membrane protein
MTKFNNEIRELNIDELDAVSGGSLMGWVHEIVDRALSSVNTPLNSGYTPMSGSGSGSASGSGGGGTPVCPGCHTPA